jgi:hypothetical protein
MALSQANFSLVGFEVVQKYFVFCQFSLRLFQFEQIALIA